MTTFLNQIKKITEESTINSLRDKFSKILIGFNFTHQERSIKNMLYFILKEKLPSI